ncbi:hypothetical protein BpHYR1_017246 [Brachionus plicatilis]|uniref:Uncharacterized protein n=1 Tax=Brachionus plicatilis TaxID=10195 RepID=A0A3M7SPR2_BRAPC|nr:hypothetical protein BpHYR1_017246 [Brachionus plicatilis]
MKEQKKEKKTKKKKTEEYVYLFVRKTAYPDTELIIEHWDIAISLIYITDLGLLIIILIGCRCGQFRTVRIVFLARLFVAIFVTNFIVGQNLRYRSLAVGAVRFVI